MLELEKFMLCKNFSNSDGTFLCKVGNFFRSTYFLFSLRKSGFKKYLAMHHTILMQTFHLLLSILI